MNFGEAKRLVLLRVGKEDGRTRLIMEQAINDAIHLVATIRDFDELMTLDITNAFTVASQKIYHIVDDLALVRPKDIYSIRYMDEGQSRKLTFVPFRELDEVVPYTEITGEGKPLYYTVRGRYIELYRIPDEVMPLYIQHSQWPDTLVDDDDEIPYVNIDPVIIALAADMTISMGEGGSSQDWTQRAMSLLTGAVKEDIERPDKVYVARPFRTTGKVPSEYWRDPFYRG